MAKLYNSPTEAIALRTLCSRDPKVSGMMLATLGEEHFHTEEGQEVFTRIKTYFNRKGEPPAFKLICEDAGLSEDAREFLKNADGVAKSSKQVDQLLGSLNEYRKTRLYYSLAKRLLIQLEKPQIDSERMENMVARTMSKVMLRRAGEADIIHIGKDSNFLEIMEDILYNENTDQIIPTGFETFDKINGGMFRGSLVTIGGNSGGGKSILANAITANQAEAGYKATLVPLEMATQEMLSRTMSRVSGQSSIDIFLKRLASGERDDIYKKMKRFDRRIANAGGRYTIYKPKEDLTMEQLMSALHSFNSDVIWIDYISLLKDADGDEQWKKLGQIARFGKIYAESHNKVVVLLAQVNEEGKLRYSQAIKEHSSLAWVFVATKESKEKGYLNIEMLKGRNQVNKPFVLGIDYGTMKVYDLKPEDRERMEIGVDNKSSGAKKGGKSSHKEGSSSDYAPDLSQE